MDEDGYRGAAAAYDLLAEPYTEKNDAALRAFLPRLDPAAGPVLDIGCGSGRDLAYLLDALPTAHVIGWEPSESLRAVAVGRLTARPEWRDRVTVRPEDALTAPLPAVLGGVLLRGVLGHFSPDERAMLWERLSAALPAGGAILFDLQPPEQPEEIAPYIFADAYLGALRYLGIAEGTALGGERMLWTMTYQTLDGDKLLEEQTAEHVFHHPSPAAVAAGLRGAGFRLDHLADTTSWAATRLP